MTIDELKNLDTSKFTRAADGWSAVSNRAAASRGRVDNEMLGKLRGTQKGDAAKAALKDLDQLSANYRYIHSECGLVRTALSGLAEELAAPQRKLKQALEEAQSLKFTVKPDGSVEYTKTANTPAPLAPTPAAPGAMPSLLKPDSTPDPNQAKAQDIANRIGEALKEATEIDGRYARALTKLNTDGNLKNTDPSDVARDVSDVRAAAGRHFSDSKIPKGKSPKENAQWWKNLPQAERDEYTALYPASIGALDGLPATVRDEANRIVLQQEYDAAKEKSEFLKSHPPEKYEQRMNARFGRRMGAKDQITPEWREWEREKKRVADHIEGMKAIQSRFEATGDNGLPDAYLLGFDTKGLGRAVVANGNPDTATHTAVYVPGTTAKLGSVDGDIRRMTDLWRTTNSIAGPQEVSTITWMGYSAPQNAHPFEKGEIIPSAAFKSYAHEAAPTLNSFLGGLREAQGGADKSHTTIIGHSYGTTVIGDASRKGDLGVDDIVSVASPGMLVKHADLLDAPKGHVWSEAAAFSKDKVPAGGKVVNLGGWEHSDPAFGLVPMPPHPVVPSDREFGANIMATDSNSHGDYWKMGSVSLRNQAAVVVEQYGEVKRG
ncbi:alpha/beta hydrolase family protein [Streptomyces sp. SCA3-4]|uniref:alpha/beta hydrolase n=1 Tax=Streptomyces sichuanensis TaxID=2871810 RepID=UPI001CE2962D|nr:alpha/beta hydrolase [Streptomyces sichuanensis]MCA6095048.1 alpha/beta hydrolase family protein [Streptomyces sichuanensis]